MTSLQSGLLLGILGILVISGWLWRRGAHQRRRAGLPRGKLVYSDMGLWEDGRIFYASAYGLSGRPDYLLSHGRYLIPVEVKPSRRAETPYDSDLLRLAAYCLLVDEEVGRRPPYGLLRYQDQTFRIPYTRRLERALLDVMDEMRTDPLSPPDRNHQDPGRCRHCGQREHCDQSLVD